MSTEVNSQPPIAWRYCGSQIKMWRTDAGVGREALAKEAGYDYEYVKSMRTADVGPHCGCCKSPTKCAGRAGSSSPRRSI
ncbi:hypothetical protein [Streptomyces sp.]|uniref:hypothetical protein n=1 Tax=Streptomyces sp. TaxID=1931 RepID=UPI003455E4C6